MFTRLTFLAALTLGAACGGSSESAPASQAEVAPSGDVARAIAVARGIDANPAATDSVLKANGLTKAGLDSLMLRIAADSGMSAQFTAAR